MQPATEIKGPAAFKAANLAKLNGYRQHLGMKPLKSWKKSNAALRDAMSALQVKASTTIPIHPYTCTCAQCVAEVDYILTRGAVKSVPNTGTAEQRTDALLGAMRGVRKQVSRAQFHAAAVDAGWTKDPAEIARRMAATEVAREAGPDLGTRGDVRAAELIRTCPDTLDDVEGDVEPTRVRPFVPSPQQQAVLDWVVRGRGNAFVQAVAGAGKTTTLLEACKLMTHKGKPEHARWHSVAFAAYNTKIADEIKAKVLAITQSGIDLSYVKAGTFHSFGMRAWSRVHPDVKVAEDDDKSKQMFQVIQIPEHLQGIVAKLISFAKNSAVLLDWQPSDRSRWHALVNHYDLADDLEDPEELDKALDFAIKGLAWHKSVSHKLIDFDDMIWLPAVTDCKVFQHKWVLTDEAQDTNPTRRALARKMLTSYSGRAMFVGDRHQAIYGFTGADNEAIDLIIKQFFCTELPLTVTYRCPQFVVQQAQKYVSHIEAHLSAPFGKIREVKKEQFLKTEMQCMGPGDAVLCRKTAPLISLAFKLIRLGISAHVEGKEIGKGLKVLARRFKARNIETWRERLETYRDRQVAKLTAKGKGTQAEGVADRVDSLLVLAEGCHDVPCVIAKVDKMFQDATFPDGSPNPAVKNAITLSTVHKAKGREWNRVYILGFAEYMPSKWARQAWDMEQENNLIYVAITRSQNELVYVEALEDGRPK